MPQALISFFITVGKNLLAMFLTKRVIVWALKLAASKTENQIDDNVVALVEAAYENNEAGVVEAVENLVKEYKPKV